MINCNENAWQCLNLRALYFQISISRQLVRSSHITSQIYFHQQEKKKNNNNNNNNNNKGKITGIIQGPCKIFMKMTLLPVPRYRISNHVLSVTSFWGLKINYLMKFLLNWLINLVKSTNDRRKDCVWINW